MTVMTDQMKKDFLNAQQEWSDAQIQIDSAKSLQKEIIGELNEKYPDVSKSDISKDYTSRYSNDRSFYCV